MTGQVLVVSIAFVAFILTVAFVASHAPACSLCRGQVRAALLFGLLGGFMMAVILNAATKGGEHGQQQNSSAGSGATAGTD